VHILGLRWHDGVHLSFILEVVPLVLLLSDEDMVLLDVGWIVVLALVRHWSQLVLAVPVLLTFSRLFWRWPRQLVGALLKLPDEAALTRGVGC
jgi:hypothetical protein